jgi:hypothetical protein
MSLYIKFLRKTDETTGHEGVIVYSENVLWMSERVRNYVVGFAREFTGQRERLESSQIFYTKFYVPQAYILHLLESCRFSKSICFPGRFRIQRDSM